MSVFRAFAFLFLVGPLAFAQDLALKTKVALHRQGNTTRDAVIVIRDGKIGYVQPNGRLSGNAKEIDLTNFTVMPGMIDMRVHITAHFGENRREPLSVAGFSGADNARRFLES